MDCELCDRTGRPRVVRPRDEAVEAVLCEACAERFGSEPRPDTNGESSGSNGGAVSPASDDGGVETWTGDPCAERTRAVLNELSKPGCLAILGATNGRAMTAHEVAEAVDLPISTAYRKVDRLSGLELLEETLRISSDGKHSSQYRCPFDRFRVDVEGATAESSDFDGLVTDPRGSE